MSSNEPNRVSWGSCFPWQRHTAHNLRRGEVGSVAGSRRTRQITGVACGAETRHSEKGRTPAVYPVMRASRGEAHDCFEAARCLPVHELEYDCTDGRLIRHGASLLPEALLADENNFLTQGTLL